MQNVQKLTCAGGCAKILCKYIANIDKHNYVVIKVNTEGRLVSKGTLMNNTKVFSSKIVRDKEQNKNANKPQVICISQFDMLHVMSK